MTEESQCKSSLDLEVFVPFIKEAAVNEFVLRLSGFNGQALKQECLRLSHAILVDLEADGDVGAIEIAVVMATLHAAIKKVREMPSGWAERMHIS